MKYLKTFESYSYDYDVENIDEGWKNWKYDESILLDDKRIEEARK